jgi:membrane protein
MIRKIKTRILKAPLYQAMIRFSKKLILPGFEGIPLHDVVIFFIRGIQKGSLNTRATSLAFKFFLAIFPGLIFLITLIPYIPIENFQEEMLALLKDILPHSAYESTASTFEDLIKNQRGGLLSLGFVLAMYLATNGINAMIGAFNKSYHTSDTRSVIKKRLIAVMLVFILFFLTLTAVALIVFSGTAIDYLEAKGLLNDSVTYALLIGAKWLTILALFFFGISFLYYFGPDTSGTKQKWKFISAGSTMATLLIVITSELFAYYVNNFGTYNKVYGSIGTLMVIMLWLEFNFMIILLGFELNASIYFAKRFHKKLIV